MCSKGTHGSKKHVHLLNLRIEVVVHLKKAAKAAAENVALHLRGKRNVSHKLSRYPKDFTENLTPSNISNPGVERISRGGGIQAKPLSRATM